MRLPMPTPRTLRYPILHRTPQSGSKAGCGEGRPRGVQGRTSAVELGGKLKTLRTILLIHVF